MKTDHNRIFYVYICFTILFINSCNAQKASFVNSFFNKRAIDCYDKCLNNDDYKYFKANDKKEAIDLTESSCKGLSVHYAHFAENSMKFLDSLDKNGKDFIILNKTLKSAYNSKPVLTILKVKDINHYSVIHNYTTYDDIKEFIVLTDHSLNGFNAEKILSLFEDYLYYGKKSLISKNIKDLPSDSEANLCYIVARVNGKFFIREYYYLDTKK